MKFTSFLVSSLLLATCSCSGFNTQAFNASKPRFGGIPIDAISHINNYIEDKFKFRNLNLKTLNSSSLKHQVQKFFNMSELENVADNEPELAGVLRLSWTLPDPVLFMIALVEEVAGGKKPYKVLFSPLMKHIVRIYHSLSPGDKNRCQEYFNARGIYHFERHLADACLRHGEIDLLFETFKNEGMILNYFVSKFEDRKLIAKTFRDNPEYAGHYLHVLLTDENNHIQDSVEHRFGLWIAECIINNLPQSYYISLFGINPRVLGFIVDHLFLSTNVSDDEYGRIYGQISDHFRTYSGDLADSQEIALLRMLNEIRFGSFDLNDFRASNINFDSISEKMRRTIAKVALLANKRDLFTEIYAKLSELGQGVRFMDNIVRFKNLNVKDYQAKSFKMIFDMIQANPDLFERDYDLEFIAIFYAFTHLRYDAGMVTFEFAAAENLLQYGFSPVMQITKDYHTVRFFINNSFARMKVFNESTLSSYMIDLIQYYDAISRPQTISYASFEVVKLLSRLPDLLNIMWERGRRINMSYDLQDLEKYFDFDNFELTRRVAQIHELNAWKLASLKTQAHIAKMETLIGMSVADCFLQWESSHVGMYEAIKSPQLIYFKWRSVLAFWLKGPDRYRISEIQNSEIISSPILIRYGHITESIYL